MNRQPAKGSFVQCEHYRLGLFSEAGLGFLHRPELLRSPGVSDAALIIRLSRGASTTEEHIKTVTRTLKAVFHASGVRDCHAHRFRYTRATEILIKGGTIEDCANILGDSPQVIRKHYAKWSPEGQRRWHVYGTREFYGRKSFRYNR
jgi:integrase